MLITLSAAAAAAASPGAAAAPPPGLSPYASAVQQQAAMAAGAVTAEALVRADIARIGALDHAGPRLNAVIALNPHALADARAADRERAAGHVRGPLHGVAILLKDNIESDDGTATTAGSLALKDNVTGRDAPVVRRLTDAGAVILGKANLSEWANFRSTRAVGGWSAVGGLVRNPYALDRTACGSSAGSAVAVAAGYVAAALGTETDGSIICPAAASGVVGFKPTVGLVPRTFIVPISPEQDTAGPIARTVADAAAVLTVIAGSDPADPSSAAADAHKIDYVAALDRNALKGARIGVLRGAVDRSPQTDAVFAQALAVLWSQGAELVDVRPPSDAQAAVLDAAETDAMRAEFKAAINAYLAAAAPAVRARTLDDLIAFNAATSAETALFGQEMFELSAKSPPLTDPDYRQKRATADRLAGPEGLDRMMREAGVEAIVAESGGPASVVDPVNGGLYLGSPTTLPAVAGYPHLTVPMGRVAGLPVGLSFIGPAWSDARILSLGYAFEQATLARIDPQFPPSVNARADIAAAYDVKP
ncbi:MAG: amidase [Caulobacteraceae bacterium]